MIKQKLNDMILAIKGKTLPNIDSVLIYRYQKLVLEEYFSNTNRESKHGIYSCTKNITATLIGIALNQGAIESVDDLHL